jgi:hypothetical protein
MLFMVVEHFKGGDPSAAGERFRTRGRLLPDGVVYHASWMTSDGARCFQIMEAPDRAALDLWVERWSDLVDFEVCEVERSSDFWARRV